MTDRLSGIPEGIGVKPPCYVATDDQIQLTGLQTLDGFTLTDGKRVLVTGQDDPTDNGIYVASSGEWSRAPDCRGNRDLWQGARVIVLNGVLHGLTEWVLTSSGTPHIIGTSTITWETLCARGAAIHLVKSGTFAGDSGAAQLGDIINYTFAITNTGIVPLTNITLEDSSATVAGGPIASLAPTAVDSSSFTASYALTQDDLDAGEHVNLATVTGTAGSSTVTDTDTHTETFTAASNPPEIEFLGHYALALAQLDHNYPPHFGGTIFIGAASSDRVIIFTAGATTNGRHITSVTFDGNPAAIYRQVFGAGAGIFPNNLFHDLLVVVGAIAIPAGTTVSELTINFDGLLDGSYISLWKATKLQSITPFHTAEGSSSGSDPSMTINVPALGILVAGYTGGTDHYGSLITDVGGVSWTGATEDWDESLNTPGGYYQASGAHASGLSVQTGRTVSVAGPAIGREIIVAATWR